MSSKEIKKLASSQMHASTSAEQISNAALQKLTKPQKQQENNKNQKNINNSLQITLKINKKTYNALIDSGASQNFISETIVSELSDSPVNLFQPCNVKLADSTTTTKCTKMFKNLNFTHQFNDKHDFYVMKNLNHDIILGFPWLVDRQPKIDWSNRKIQFSDDSIRNLTTNSITSIDSVNDSPSTNDSTNDSVSITFDSITEFSLTSDSNPESSSTSDSTTESSSISDSISESSPSDSISESSYFLSDNSSESSTTSSFDEDLSPFFDYCRSITLDNQDSTQFLSHEVDSSSTTTSSSPSIPPEYLDLQPVFSEVMADVLPKARKYDCPIDLIPGSRPPFKSIYQLSPLESECLRKYVDDNLAKGFIRPSTSPYGSPIFFVPKKDGDLRPCVDYRELNAITIKNRHPLPLIPEILDRLATAKIFTKLDLRGAYNLVRIRKGDEEKTAFRCQFGHFEYTVMPFGLCNAPAVFQAMMIDIFRDIIDRYVVIYLDDIMVFSPDFQAHVQHVREVLSRLQSHQLYVKLSKCQFHVPSVEFLGFVVSSNGFSMSNDKVASIQSWKQPTNPKELMSFLGFANYYRKFIPNFSKLGVPLFGLLKKNTPFIWDTPQQSAFETLKAQFISGPVLKHVESHLPFLVETDASDYAIGAVLSQFPSSDTSDPSSTRPVAFFSKRLLPAEVNYSVHDKELFAIVSALQHWRHYLLGSPTPILVLSDHRNLEYFRNKPILRPRHARWQTFLSDFDFRLVYRPGSANSAADALSRLDPPASKEGCDFVSPLSNENWAQIQSVTLVSDPDQRLQIIESRHDSPLAGHFGFHKTYSLIKKEFTWKNMRSDIKNYVTSCRICQLNKTIHKNQTFPVMPIPPPDSPWTIIGIDFITKLPISKGFDSIFVVIDHFTKMAHFLPCKEAITASETAELFFKNIVKLHGLPVKIISDRGPQFISKFWNSLFEYAGVKISLTSAFNPQSNGQTERTNQTIESYLRCYLNFQQDNWVDLLSSAEFAFNNSISATTGFTPFESNYGYHPRADFLTSTSKSSIKNPSAESFIHTISNNHQILYERLLKSKVKISQDQNSIKFKEFKVGDQVLLRTKNLATVRPSKKLDALKAGPYQIIEKISPVSYKLNLPPSLNIHPTFHIRLLEQFKSRTNEHSQPESNVTFDNEYHVEKILDAKFEDDTFLYLVKWKNYPIEEASWEPLQNLSNCLPLVRRFHTNNPQHFSPPPKALFKRRVMLR